MDDQLWVYLICGSYAITMLSTIAVILMIVSS